MAKRIAAGDAVRIGGNVRAIADSLGVSGASTIYALIQLQLDGHADDLKFWDENDDTWQTEANVVFWPTASLQHGSYWYFDLPAAASTGKEGADLVLLDLTDNEATPASETTIAGGFQTVHVKSAAELALEALTNDTIADQVWEEILADHSGTAGSTAEKLNSISGTAGSRSIDFTIDDGSSGVPGALITVLNAAADAVITVGTCDANGLKTLPLNDATYTVRVTAAGYALADQALVVSADAAVGYSMTAFAAPSPSDPDNCTLYGYTADISDAVYANATVTVAPESVSSQGVFGAGKAIKTAAVSTTTNGSGYFAIEAIKGVKVRLTIADAGVVIIKDVPNAASQDVSTW